MKKSPQVFTKYGERFIFRIADTNEPITYGTSVKSFRNEIGHFEGIGRIGRLGDPKVIIDGYEYNASVWGLSWEMVHGTASVVQ